MPNGIVLQPDTVTLGRWIGKYGEGYFTARSGTTSLPSWLTSLSAPTGAVAITLPNTDNYMQVPGTSDSNTVYAPSASINIDLTIADNEAYVTSVYILSSTSSRRVGLTLLDPTGTTTYSSYTDPTSWGSQGRWYRAIHSGGSVRVRVDQVSGTVPFCGIVFDRYVGQFGNSCEV